MKGQHSLKADEQINLRTRKPCWNTQQPADLSVSRHVCYDYLKRTEVVFAEVTHYCCTFVYCIPPLLQPSAILRKLK